MIPRDKALSFYLCSNILPLSDLLSLSPSPPSPTFIMSLLEQPNLSHDTLLRDLADVQLNHFQDVLSYPSETTGKIIVLNGFPGTGKLTILKHLKSLLPADTTCLLDNHLLIDPVVAVIPDRSESHHALRRSVRAPIFEELSNQAKKGHTILMTACLATGCLTDEAFYQEHLNISRRSHTTIYWINVKCRRAIHEQRVSTPERQQDSKTKLTNKRLLRLISETHKLIEPQVISRGDNGVDLVFEELDVSGSVEDSVRCLVDILGRSFE